MFSIAFLGIPRFNSLSSFVSNRVESGSLVLFPAFVERIEGESPEGELGRAHWNSQVPSKAVAKRRAVGR